MAKMNIHKADFVQAINDIKKTYDFMDKLNDFFDEYGAEGYVFPPSCADTTIKLLAMLTNDTTDLIGYFCFDLEFGQKYHDGWIKDENGNNITLTSPEELYDFLAAG